NTFRFVVGDPFTEVVQTTWVTIELAVAVANARELILERREAPARAYHASKRERVLDEGDTIEAVQVYHEVFGTVGFERSRHVGVTNEGTADFGDDFADGQRVEPLLTRPGKPLLDHG